MSILTMEYDVEMAKKVYGEELLEKKTLEIAKKMLRRGTTIEIVVEDTGLDEAIVMQLKMELENI